MLSVYAAYTFISEVTPLNNAFVSVTVSLHSKNVYAVLAVSVTKSALSGATGAAESSPSTTISVFINVFRSYE